MHWTHMRYSRRHVLRFIHGLLQAHAPKRSREVIKKLDFEGIISKSHPPNHFSASKDAPSTLFPDLLSLVLLLDVVLARLFLLALLLLAFLQFVTACLLRRLFSKCRAEARFGNVVKVGA